MYALHHSSSWSSPAACSDESLHVHVMKVLVSLHTEYWGQRLAEQQCHWPMAVSHCCQYWCMLETKGMQEDIRDLLAPDLAASPGVHIREVGGSICLAGAHETEVGSRDEMATLLDQVHHSVKPALTALEHKTVSTCPRPAGSAPGCMYQEERQVGGEEAMLKDGMQDTTDNLQIAWHTQPHSEALLDI